MKLVKKLGEIATRELPFKRFTDSLPVILEVKKAFGDGVKVGKIIGSQNLPLDDGKIDFNLIEPTGMDRTVHQDQTGVLVFEALNGRHAAMGRTVINDPKHAAGIVDWRTWSPNSQTLQRESGLS